MDIIYTNTGSSGNCTIIYDGQSYLMIDCGISDKIVNKEINYTLSKVKDCLITHHHSDHTSYMPYYVKRGITMYMSKYTKEKLGVNGYFFKTISSRQTININTFYVIPFELPHSNSDGTECVNFGYLIYSKATKERLVFCTDCHYIPQRFPPCEYYMLECNYKPIENFKEDMEFINPYLEERRIRSHMSVLSCELFFQKQDLSKCKGIYLLHISHTNGDFSQEFKERIAEATRKEVFLSESIHKRKRA